MTKINDGGPVFPLVLPSRGKDAYTGMSLRDAFAISVSQRLGDWSDPEYQKAAAAARAKYIWAEADAMLAAREVKP